MVDPSVINEWLKKADEDFGLEVEYSFPEK